VKDEAGETYIVVAMINHETAKRQVARPILDSLIDWVAASKHAQVLGLIRWRSPPSKCHHSLLMPRQPASLMTSRNSRRFAMCAAVSSPRARNACSSAGWERSVKSSNPVPISSSRPAASNERDVHRHARSGSSRAPDQRGIG